MRKHIKQIILITVGLAMMTTGLILTITSIVGDVSFAIGIAFIPVGATATVSAIRDLLNEIELVHNRVVVIAYKILKRYSKIVRYNHHLELVLTYEKQSKTIMVKGIHKYELRNPSFFRNLQLKLSIYTDIGREGDPSTGGFEYVRIGNEEFTGKKLSDHIEMKHQKTYFYRDAIVVEKKKIAEKDTLLSFEYRTYGLYDLDDRLIWTVQDLSEDFAVKVINNTGFTQELMLKFNHNDEDKVIQQFLQRLDEGREYSFSFGAPILPYQGFELSWRFPIAN